MFTPPLPPEQPSPSGILKLNVGGKKFATTYLTVSNINGMLSAMFSGRHALAPDAEGYHFIDRDGTHFRHILNLLRFPTEFEVDLPKGKLRELEREVRYYGLSEAYALAREILTPIISATSALASKSKNGAYFTVGDEVFTAVNVATLSQGWSVLLYDPKINTIISRTSSNTLEDVSAEQRLTSFLNAVPEGFVVAIAVFGKVAHETSSLCAALQCLGGSGRDIGTHGSFAMVGQKGWGSGSAAEAYNEDGQFVTATRPASRW
ncbi:BTB/POZ protein [Ochromonadaceae sp. CCMP2298]|nr:BTB/POZ protein [Ochromonadaceae sp. CCMP2298]